jgi:hypothetical protein
MEVRLGRDSLWLVVTVGDFLATGGELCAVAA